MPSVIEVIVAKASYYFVNGFTRNIFTWARISLNSFLCYTGNLVNVVYSNCSFSRSHISRRRIHMGSKNSDRHVHDNYVQTVMKRVCKCADINLWLLKIIVRNVTLILVISHKTVVEIKMWHTCWHNKFSYFTCSSTKSIICYF